MDGRAASRRFLALLLGGGVLALIVVTSPVGWPGTLLLLPWVLAVGGPGAVLLLHESAAEDERGWLRLVAAVLPGAMVGFAVGEASGPRPVDPTHVAIEASLVVGALVGAALAWRRSDRAARGWMLASAVVFGALLLLRVTLAGLAFFALEAALFLGVAEFHRSLRAWATATFAGLLTLFAGMTLVLLLRGALWPPRVVLDHREFVLMVVPALALATLVACGTLLLWRDGPTRRVRA